MGRMQLLKGASSAVSRLLHPQPLVLESKSWPLSGVSRKETGLLATSSEPLRETLVRGLSSCSIVADAAVDASYNSTFEGNSSPSYRSPSLSRLYAALSVSAEQAPFSIWQQSLKKARLCDPNLGKYPCITCASRSYSTNSKWELPDKVKKEIARVEEDEDGGSWEDENDGSGEYETILAEVLDEGQIGLLTIDRPDVLNALSSQVMFELEDALKEFDADPAVKVIILTGSGDKAFAAGADIKEMRDQDFVSAYMSRLLSGYEAATSACRTPIIAAVNGYALGGGCELAMMCDVILAGENAVFGQPEMNLGVTPGMGGTQRLIRAVGKSRAMEMILSGGHFIKAEEAVDRGLASRVIPGDSEQLLDAAIELAQEIARKSVPVVAMAKEAVNSANDLPLSEGVRKENMLFSACFGLHDQKEGMTAFLEKRKPKFEDK